jgi:hypothetical protein
MVHRLTHHLHNCIHASAVKRLGAVEGKLRLLLQERQAGDSNAEVGGGADGWMDGWMG